MDCENCEYYDADDGICTAFVCDPFECDTELPCEETDALTLYAEKDGVYV